MTNLKNLERKIVLEGLKTSMLVGISLGGLTTMIGGITENEVIKYTGLGLVGGYALGAGVAYLIINRKK